MTLRAPPDPGLPTCSSLLLQGRRPALPVPPEEDPETSVSGPLLPCELTLRQWPVKQETGPLGAGALLLLVPRAQHRLSAA